ncbi:MAG: hypothetical protein AAF709_25555 [Pseudomonadota bacterium]
MSDLSLRLPYLIYLAIGSMLFGVLIAPAFRDMPAPAVTASEMPMTKGHDHGSIEVPAVGAPQIAMQIVKDPTEGWNVTLQTANFTFTPEAVNQDNTTNTGHAHLYVGGVKHARIYGSHFHIPDLAPGQHEVIVALSSNDHSFYEVAGNPIEARAIIVQGDPLVADE